MKFNVSEVFGPTIQGEGTCYPSIFIRTDGCSLACCFGKVHRRDDNSISSYSSCNSTCDTAYTSHYHESLQYNSVEDTLSAVFKIKEENPQVDHLVITGGEPLLQQDALNVFLEQYKKKYPYDVITVETNGTMGWIHGHIDLVSCSPKLSSSCCFENSGITEALMKKHLRNRFNPEAIYNLVMFNSAGQFKFVCSDDGDAQEIKRWFEDVKEYVKNHYYVNYEIFCARLKVWKVMLMPEGATKEQIEKSAERTVEMCIKNGWIYTDRIHIRIWDSKRRV